MAQRLTFPVSSADRRRARRRPTPAPTREKLLEAAAEVFAERGYYKATIREICRRAGANVAAVNYTFGDKLGLYTEVLRQSVRAPEMARMTEALDAARSPEDVLRKVIQARLLSLCGRRRPDWAFQIVMHEFSQPTPAMTRVIDEGMRPIYERVLKAVGEMLGLPPEHEKTRLCNNSIIGQVLFYTFSQPVLSRLQPDLKLTPQQLERIAEHISEFSLAYLKEMSRQKATQAKQTREAAFQIETAASPQNPTAAESRPDKTPGAQSNE
jgi:TetR/AcrR family transcriptional regulator, regulator of cefoperazone and chloramphenicol sensitivity